MNYNTEDYIDKLIKIYPNDTYSKWGYIRRVDDLGFVYEVTKANERSDLGTFFVSHSRGFKFRLMEENEEVCARFCKETEEED